MALVKCKECGKEVAKSAKNCPACGVKHPGITGKESAKGCFGIIVVALVISILVYACEDKSPLPAAKSTYELNDEAKWTALNDMSDCALALDMTAGAIKFLEQLHPYAKKGSNYTFPEYAAALDAANYEAMFQQWRNRYPTIGSDMPDYPVSRMAVTEIIYPVSQLSFLIGSRLQDPDDAANNQKIKEYVTRIQTAEHQISSRCKGE